MLKVPWWKMACNLPVNVSTVSMSALPKPLNLWWICFVKQITCAVLHIVAAFHLTKESGLDFRILPRVWDIMFRFTISHWISAVFKLVTILLCLHIDPNILNVRSIQFRCRITLRNSVLSAWEIHLFSNSLGTFQESFCPLALPKFSHCTLTSVFQSKFKFA